jgi:phage gp16-like protein
MPVQKLIAKIKIAQKQLGLEDSVYRDILYRKFRVSSEESLADSQALVLIGYLERLARGEALNRKREEWQTSRTSKNL